MNSQQFVEAIEIAVEQSSIKGIRDNLIAPPGRKPDAALLKMSDWYNNLSDDDKNMVIEIAHESVRFSLFGFFCVLDGVRPIEDEEEKGSLKLYFEKGADRVLINNPDEEFLHDLYNSK